MRDGHYAGYYSMQESQLDELYIKLTNKLSASMALIEAWNKCADANKVFHKVLAIDDRAKIVMKAMRNQFFAENNISALKKLYVLMTEDFMNDDPRSFVRPTIQWFCETRYDKFVVAKIMEGEYGTPKTKKRRQAEQKEEENNDFSNPEEALQFFNSIKI
jgi:hypothetical protein